MITAIDIVICLLALYGTVGVVSQVSITTKKRKHDNCMRNIAKLEIELGLGLDYTSDWIKQQKPIWGKNKKYSHTAELYCVICKTKFNRDGRPENDLILCRNCRNSIHSTRRKVNGSF